VAIEALAGVLGGTQSLHTDSFDEALALPTEHAVRLALRTQQVIASESGVADTADPLGGSYFVESLTDEIEAAARLYLDRIDEMGGAVSAIEAGFMQDEIDQAAYDFAKAVDAGEKVVVGLNSYVEEATVASDVFPIDPVLQTEQIESLRRTRAARDNGAVSHHLAELADAARGTQNLLFPMKEALRQRATIGEVSDVLRQVFGVYRPA
jgi:methylmalonyl-CoA mutase N-terminal domain/subunit